MRRLAEMSRGTALVAEGGVTALRLCCGGETGLQVLLLLLFVAGQAEKEAEDGFQIPIADLCRGKWRYKENKSKVSDKSVTALSHSSFHIITCTGSGRYRWKKKDHTLFIQNLIPNFNHFFSSWSHFLKVPLRSSPDLFSNCSQCSLNYDYAICRQNKYCVVS